MPRLLRKNVLRTRLVSTFGQLLTCTFLLTSLAMVTPAQAVEPATGPIPECTGIGNNCVYPAGSANLVAPLATLTPAATVVGAELQYDFTPAAIGQGPLCPSPIHIENVPCQDYPSATFALYDPSLPPTATVGLVPYGTVGVRRGQATGSGFPDYTEHILVSPTYQPHGVTLIASVQYLQFYADNPAQPQSFTSKGQDYQVILHLLPAPPPTAPIEISIQPARDLVAPGQDSTVDVVLTSTGPDQSATVTLDPALASRNGLFELTPPGGAGGPHAIPGGGSRTITFGVHAGATLGLDELFAAGEAVDANGLSWPLSASSPIEVGVRAIEAAITFDPPEITLAENAAGPTPEDVTMHVAVKNVSATAITSVALLLGKPGWQKVNPHSTYVPGDVVALKDPVPNDEYALADLDPGQSTTIDIVVTVKDDGHIEWGGLVRYTKDGHERLDQADPGKLTSIPTYLMRFELKPWPGTGEIVDASIDDLPSGLEPWNTPQIVKAGEIFGLLGQVENRTTDQVVMAELPTTDLQNINSAVFRGAASGGSHDVYAAGLPYRETLDPGSTEVVGSFPSTVENETFGPGETFSSRLTVVPKVAAPNADDTYSDALVDKVLTVGALTASAATMTPPTLPGPDVAESYLGRFAIGYTEGGIKFVKGTSETIGWVLSKIPEIPTMTTQASIAFVNVGSRLVNGLVSVGTELSQMTLAERSAFAYGLAQDAIHFVLVKTPNATGAVLNAIVTLSNQVVEKLMSAAFFDADPGAFWQSLGSFTSQAIGELSVGWLTDAAVAKVLIGLKDARGFVRAEQFLSEQAKTVGLKLEKGLAGILPGTLITDRMLALGMGITRAQKDYMIAVARKWGVNIYARSRGARAIELIEKGLATVKPYFIKPKSVNDIDKIFLGFEKLESDVVAMRRPNSWEQVSAKMDGFVDPATGDPLTADQRGLVIDRWQKRNKEWFGDKGAPGHDPIASDANFLQSDRYKLGQKSGKVQNLTLETEGNLEDAYEGKSFLVKPTKFQLIASPADPEALVPQLFEGSWKSIVGDIDLVAITLPNGRVPDVETLIKIYEDLQLPPLDMQHSATLTWLNQGAAASMLKDHLGAAAEPLIEASVSSRLRAVLFDPQMSFENGDYFKKGAQFVHLAGGEINAPRAWGIGGAITVSIINNAHKDYAPPSVFPADMKRTAPPTRIGVNGLETLVKGVWVPAAPRPTLQATTHRSVASLDAAPRLVVGVQTAVAATVPAGTTALPILSLAQLYPDGSRNQGWFRPGDKVIVDPGTESAFITALVAVGGRLVLAHPLPAEVLAGTMVAMVPDVAAQPTPTDSTEPTVSTVPTVSTEPNALPDTGAGLRREVDAALALVGLGGALSLAGAASRRRPRARKVSSCRRERRHGPSTP